MENKHFDKETLLEALSANPFACNGNLDSSYTDVDGKVIILDFGNEHTIVDIVDEVPNEGIVDLLTTDNQKIRIQFFKPARFDELNLSF